MRKNRISNTIFTVLAVLGIFCLLVYGIYYNKLANERKIETENNYQRTFYDLINYLEESQNYLLKALSAGSEKNLSLMLEEAWKSSVQAEACISMLPLDHNLMSNSSKYLVQLSDMARSWSDRADGGLSDDEYDTLSEMYGYAQDLTGTFETMAVEVIKSGASWSELSKVSTDAFDGIAPEEKYSFFNGFTATFNDYPSLIYDGPFSDSAIKPYEGDLPGVECDSETGAAKINSFFRVMGETTSNVNFTGTSVDNNLLLLNYTVELKSGDTSYVALTSDGGHIYSISMYSNIGSSVISSDEAYSRGEELLKSMNYPNMTSSYGITEGNCITINYSYDFDGIIYYPDMVKLKLSLDDGRLIGFDARGYVFNHYKRKQISKDDVKISESEARDFVSPKLTVNNVNLCVIPNENGSEEFAYEFQCYGMGREILVYIDAINGEECEILIKDSMDGYI